MENTPVPVPEYQNGKQFYVGLVKHVLLLLFTFGIWYLIWIYKMGVYMHEDEEDPGFPPVVHLLLSLFIPPYQIYFFFKLAQKLDKDYEKAGKKYDRTLYTLIFVLCTLCIGGPIAAVIAQDQVNRLADPERYAPKTIVCKACGKEFLDNHAVCPHCGASYKEPFYKQVWFKVLAVLAALAVLWTIFVCGFLLITGLRSSHNSVEVPGNDYGYEAFDEAFDEAFGEDYDIELTPDGGVNFRIDNGSVHMETA